MRRYIFEALTAISLVGILAVTAMCEGGTIGIGLTLFSYIIGIGAFTFFSKRAGFFDVNGGESDEK